MTMLEQLFLFSPGSRKHVVFGREMYVFGADTFEEGSGLGI